MTRMAKGTTMRTAMLGLAIAAAIPLAACGAANDGGAATSEAGLKIVAVVVRQGDRRYVFSAEVAASTEEQAKGLMYRRALAPDAAMLFPFPQPKFASFWMKDTLIPLDMVFVRADGTIDRIAEQTVPGNLEPVASGGEVAAVLELAGGTAERLGLDDSATVTWTLPE